MAKHKPPFCGGKLHQGEGTCTQPPGWGTSHPGHGRCKLHGGSTPASVKAAEHAMAEEAATMLGLPVVTTAEAALQDELDLANGRCRWLAVKIASLAEEEIVFGDLSATRTARTGGDGPSVEERTTRSAGLSVWVQLEHQERRHRAEVAKAMLAANVAVRQVELAEAQGQLLARMVARALDDAGLAPADRERVVLALPAAIHALDPGRNGAA
jgi:hypothetical protein